MSVRTGRAVREAQADAERRDREHAKWKRDVRRRIRAGEDPDAALVADLDALRARDAYRRRACSIAIAIRGLDIDNLSGDALRILSHADARWPLSGLWRRDLLDSLAEAAA